MKELYVIVKKFDDGGEEAGFAYFDLNTAIIEWQECFDNCEKLYYSFELRKYNIENFEVLKKVIKTLDKNKNM